jgi:MoaA/NifB/PqqE/SkfB family radical SAM enzyme
LPSLKDHQTASRELKLPEIAQLSQHLGPDIYSVLLAGGEPFLRKDLGDILEVLSRNRQLQAIKVVTNGFFTERVVSTYQQLLARRHDKYYGVTMSFDGMRELHDYIRGVPGIFDRAVDTFQQLKRLESQHANFEVDVNVTISRFNQDHLDPLYEHLRDALCAGNIICTVTRGQPREPRAKGVDYDRYSAFTARLAKDLSNGSLNGHARFRKSDTLNAVNIIQRKRIQRMLRRQTYISPCNAGRLSAVIGSDGKVYACELLNDVLGDLREYDYDLMKIWDSSAARTLRERIVNNKCFCTYENANLLNVLFSPRYIPAVLAKALEIKIGRILRNGNHVPPVATPSQSVQHGASLDHLILQ